jgi:ribonuclease HII
MSIISNFYDKYDGHKDSHLQIIYNKLKDANTDGLIYLAGDSSLDNKHWLKPPYTTEKRVNAVNGYETIEDFNTKGCLQDVAYHINNEINEFNKIHSKEIKMACINTSIEATKLAMSRALEQLEFKPDYLIIDGIGWEKKFQSYNIKSIIKGDANYYSIAAASIIAKEYHDGHIKTLCINHPELVEKYDLLNNMGYGTRKHIEGIKKYGLSEFHRKSFKLKS